MSETTMANDAEEQEAERAARRQLALVAKMAAEEHGRTVERVRDKCVRLSPHDGRRAGELTLAALGMLEDYLRAGRLRAEKALGLVPVQPKPGVVDRILAMVGLRRARSQR